MTRFWRVFVVGAVLFALSSVLCLLMVGVIEQWISVPTSLVLGGAFGGAMGGIGSAFARKRLGGLRSVAATLAMSAVGLAAGLALSLLLDFWISMPLPRGRWSPMENQPPKRPIAFLGESSDVSPRPGDSLGLYVQTADGTVYRCEGRAWTGSCTWSEERTPDRPTTILGAGSYGLEAPPLLRRTLSRQSVFTEGPGIWQTFHFAITEDGTVWQCHFGGNDLSGPGSKLGITAFLSTLSGFLSSLALLFGGRMAVG